MRSVGRPNIVPREEALSRAMHVFWSLGYQRASLPVLEEATGLRRGSLYQHFKDKRSLFDEVLDLYGSEALAAMDRMMPPGATRADILAWVRFHATRAHGKAGQRGCLLIEATVEMGPHDPLIAAKSAKIFTLMLGRLEKAIAKAPDLEAVDPKATARAVLAFLEGLRVLGKTGQSKTQVERVVEHMADGFFGAAPKH